MKLEFRERSTLESIFSIVKFVALLVLIGWFGYYMLVHPFTDEGRREVKAQNERGTYLEQQIEALGKSIKGCGCK